MLTSPNRSRVVVLLAFLAGVITAALVTMVFSKLAMSVDVASPLAAPTTPPPGQTGAAAHTFAQSLRQGGHILYFRHGQRQKWDSVIAFDVYELATGQDGAKSSYRDAICLTPQGIEEARMMGAVLALAGIPVGHVASSPSCRARQTAQIAFGRIDGIHMALAHTPVVNPANAQAFKTALGQVLTNIPIPAGANTVIAAHENTIVNHPDLFASGTQWLKMGMVNETGLYVLRRDERGQLHVVHRFGSLGDLAAAAITLRVER